MFSHCRSSGKPGAKLANRPALDHDGLGRGIAATTTESLRSIGSFVTRQVNELMRKLARSSPRAKSALLKFVLSRRFHSLAESDIPLASTRLNRAWQADVIPQRQRKIVDPDIASYRAGKSHVTFDAFVDMLNYNISDLYQKTLLEVGCSSGYYSEVLRIRGLDVSYRGCDYSDAFVRLARQIYPSVSFDVEDATALSYASKSFDIVVSGCCLLHIPAYEKAVFEAARVSKEFVLFHRTPVLHLGEPRFYTKKAYGTEVIEIHFNEQQLMRLFGKNGLDVVDVNTQLSLPEPHSPEQLFYKSYLCLKREKSQQ